jgi:hypothetical protein
MVFFSTGSHEAVNSVLNDMKKKKSLRQRKLDTAEQPTVFLAQKRKPVPVEYFGTASASTGDQQPKSKKRVPPKLSEVSLKDFPWKKQ